MRYDKDMQTIDDYIKTQSQELRTTLQNIRKTIKRAAPKAEEAIRYNIPTFRLNNKNLVHFASHKQHFAFYPSPSPIKQFSEELKDYNTSKGTIRFSLETPIPYNLIVKTLKFRISEINTKG